MSRLRMLSSQMVFRISVQTIFVPTPVSKAYIIGRIRKEFHPIDSKKLYFLVLNNRILSGYGNDRISWYGSLGDFLKVSLVVLFAFICATS